MRRAERLAFNEMRLRGVAPFGDWNPPTRFCCECSRPECDGVVEIPAGDYAAMRENRLHFVVVPGHVRRPFEAVVGRNDRYAIVEAARKREDPGG